MGKMIVPVLALVAVGIAAWFLMSTDEKSTTVPDIKPVAAETATPAPTAKSPATAARRPIVKNALPKRRPSIKPESGVGRAAPDMPAIPPRPAAAAAPVSARPIIKQPLVQVQASVRQFYGNLPKSGKVPSRVTIEEVLPIGLIEQLGAPRDAEITMLGPFPISDSNAFKDVLSMDQRYDTMLGVTWKGADGTETRDYVALEAPDSPKP